MSSKIKKAARGIPNGVDRVKEVTPLPDRQGWRFVLAAGEFGAANRLGRIVVKRRRGRVSSH